MVVTVEMGTMRQVVMRRLEQPEMVVMLQIPTLSESRFSPSRIRPSSIH
jgi:hypothetical protein